MKKVISVFIFGLMVVGLGVTAKADEAVPEQAYGGYCCDAWGVKRCVLQYPAPLGSGCYCYGQGNGYTCY